MKNLLFGMIMASLVFGTLIFSGCFDSPVSVSELTGIDARGINVEREIENAEIYSKKPSANAQKTLVLPGYEEDRNIWRITSGRWLFAEDINVEKVEEYNITIWNLAGKKEPLSTKSRVHGYLTIISPFLPKKAYDDETNEFIGYDILDPNGDPNDNPIMKVRYKYSDEE